MAKENTKKIKTIYKISLPSIHPWIEKIVIYLAKGYKRKKGDKILPEDTQDFVQRWMDDTIRYLFILKNLETEEPQNERNSAIIKDLNAPISFSLLDETIVNHYEKYGKFPILIYLSIEQYLDYPHLFSFRLEVEKALRAKQVFYHGIFLKPINKNG